MKGIRTFIIIVSMVLLLCMGCTSNDVDQTKETNSPVTLLLSAAISVNDVMAETIRTFEKEHPDIRVEVNAASSGTLQKQIEQGAPADLFISAGSKHMEQLVEQGMVEQSVPLFGNQLVAISQGELIPSPSSLEDLLIAMNARHIAIGDPDTVPAGQYSKQALEKAGLWTSWQDRYVYGKDVRQVLAYVEQGNAELGFVYRTDAMSSDKVQIVYEVDVYDPIVYPVAIVSATKEREAAQQFYSYLLEESQKHIYEQYGFQVMP